MGHSSPNYSTSSSWLHPSHLDQSKDTSWLRHVLSVEQVRLPYFSDQFVYKLIYTEASGKDRPLGKHLGRERCNVKGSAQLRYTTDLVFLGSECSKQAPKRVLSYICSILSYSYRVHRSTNSVVFHGPGQNDRSREQGNLSTQAEEGNRTIDSYESWYCVAYFASNKQHHI